MNVYLKGSKYTDARMKELCEYIEVSMTYECIAREFLLCSVGVFLGCAYVFLSGGLYAG